MGSILYLDDQATDLVVFKENFKHSYDIHTAKDEEEAVGILDKEDIQIVISDQCLGNTSGIEFLSKVKQVYPETIRIILTAYADIDVVISAFHECGIYRFITKPIDIVDMKITLDNALETYSLKKQNQDLIKHLEATNIKLEEKIKQKTNEVRSLNTMRSEVYEPVITALEKSGKQLADGDQLVVEIEKDSPYQKAKDSVSEVSDSILMTNELIEQLYRWAKLELNEPKYSPQKCVLNDLINDNVEVLDMSAARHKVVLRNNTSDDGVAIKSDKSMLNFMIYHMMLSAIKAGEENSDIAMVGCSQNGLGIISLTGKSDELNKFITEGSHISNKVSDTGEYQSLKLSFMLFRKYLKMMGGRMLVDAADRTNEYSINFVYPSMY